MDYEVSFRGGKTQTDEFKGDLHHYVGTSITKFFDYDGDILKFSGGEEDLVKIRHFTGRHNGEVIVLN